MMSSLDRKGSGEKRGLVGTGRVIVALVLAGAAAGGVYYFRPRPAPKPPPPPKTATVEEAREYLAGDDFDRLPMKQRMAWLEDRLEALSEMDEAELRESVEDMDEETRRRIRRNIGRVIFTQMSKSVDDFHELPESQREAFLDEQIDRMQTFRQVARKIRGPRDEQEGASEQQDQAREMQARNEQDSRSETGRDGKKHPRGGMMGLLSLLPADRQARITAYHKALTNRMKERGIEPLGRARGQGGDAR